MMMLSGGPDDPPIRIGFPIVDTVTGQTAAIAILGALLRRANGGGGSHIDVAMFDAALAFMTSTVTPFLVTGQPMPRMGNTGYSGLPTASLFEARDGRLVSLGVVQTNQFAALCHQLERADWLDDPRFATADARRANFSAMTEELAVAMKKRDAADWERRLAAAGVPCGMVRSVDEAVELSREGSILDLKIDGLPNGDAIAIPGLGFRLDNDQPDIGDAPPRLDADRLEILDWLDGRDKYEPVLAADGVDSSA